MMCSSVSVSIYNMYRTIAPRVVRIGINAIKRNDRWLKNLYLYETFLSTYFVEACF